MSFNNAQTESASKRAIGHLEADMTPNNDGAVGITPESLCATPATARATPRSVRP